MPLAKPAGECAARAVEGFRLLSSREMISALTPPRAGAILGGVLELGPFPKTASDTCGTGGRSVNAALLVPFDFAGHGFNLSPAKVEILDDR